MKENYDIQTDCDQNKSWGVAADSAGGDGVSAPALGQVPVLARQRCQRGLALKPSKCCKWSQCHK